MRRISLKTLQTAHATPRASAYRDVYLSRLVARWRETVEGRAVLTLKAGETLLGVVENKRGSSLLIGHDV